MRKIICTLLSLVLIAGIVMPKTAKAESVGNAELVTPEGYDIEIIEKGNIRTVVLNDGSLEHVATFNLITEELVIDGETMPEGLVESIKDLEKQYAGGINLGEDLVSPLQLDPGGGDYYKLNYSFNFQLADWYTLATLFSLTVAVVTLAITTATNATLEQNLIFTIASTVTTAIATYKIPSLYITVSIYKRTIGKIDYMYYFYFYGDKQRTNLLKYYVTS